MHVLDTKIDSSHSQEPLGTNPTSNRGRNRRQWSFSLLYTKKHRKTRSFRAYTRSFRILAVQAIRTHPEYPGTHRTHPTFSCLIALHLPKSNTHMCYMSRLFYHGFTMLKHALSCHLHIITIIHGISIYQASLHSCRDRDA